MVEKASNPNLYKAVESLLPESEVENVYQYLSQRLEGFNSSEEESDTDIEVTNSYSFANNFIYNLSLTSLGLDDCPDDIIQLSHLVGTYKKLYQSYYGGLEGAFTTGSKEGKGFVFSDRYKDTLWEESDSGSVHKPEMVGYLTFLGERSSVSAPLPVEQEPTEGQYKLSQLLYGDKEVLASENEESEEDLSEEELSSAHSILYKLSSIQLNELPEVVKRFDSLENGESVELSATARRNIINNLENLPDVENEDLDPLIIGYRLATHGSIPLELIQSHLPSSDKSYLLGGEIGLRQVFSQLRDLSFSTSTDGEAVQSLSQGISSPSPIPIQIELSTGVSDQSRKAKIPIAKIGKWKHPVYGEVEFTQKDFDQMVKNFENKATGFEPPLFLGHENPRGSAVDGLPSQGLPEKLSQEGDVLFGYYDIYEDDVYQDIEKKKYRYASPEYVKNFTCKETGKKLGTALIGNALTNRPHMTRLPTAQALSDASHKGMVLDIQNEESDNKKSDVSEEESKGNFQPESPEVDKKVSSENSSSEDDLLINEALGGGEEKKSSETVNSTKENRQMEESNENQGQQPMNSKEEENKQEELTQSESQTAVSSESTSPEMFDELKKLTQRIAQLEGELSQRDERIDHLEQDKKSREKEQRLSQIQSMSVNQATKDKYKELVEKEKLSSEQFDEVIQLLSTASEESVQTLTQQHGTVTATEEENKESEEGGDNGIVNPYKDIIEQNLSQAKERKQN